MAADAILTFDEWQPGDCLQRLWFDILDIERALQTVMNGWINENVSGSDYGQQLQDGF